MVGRAATILLSSGAALASIAAAPDDANREMLAAFDAVLTGMAYAGVGLCLFAIVWAGFLLMAEGAEGAEPGPGQERRNHGGGRAGGGPAGQGHRPTLPQRHRWIPVAGPETQNDNKDKENDYETETTEHQAPGGPRR